MPMVDELARGEHRGHEFRSIDHRVQTALQEADQVFAGVALQSACLDIDAVELALGNVGVVALELLFGAELHAEVGELSFSALAMLTRAVFPAVHGALGAAPDVLAHAAIDLVFRLTALSHRVLLRFQRLRGTAPSCASENPEPTGPTAKASS